MVGLGVNPEIKGSSRRSLGGKSIPLHGLITYQGLPVDFHFAGRDEEGNCASFRKCGNLKVAAGTFFGMVDFTDSGIEPIDAENLVIVQPNKEYAAAFFSNCKDLKIATGTYPGFVSFWNSGVT